MDRPAAAVPPTSRAPRGTLIRSVLITALKSPSASGDFSSIANTALIRAEDVIKRPGRRRAASWPGSTILRWRR